MAADTVLPPARSPADLAEWLRQEAVRLGFHRVGIAPPSPDPRAAAFYRRWLEEGLHGEMAWMASESSVARRVDPGLTLPGVRSVVVVTHRYAGPSERTEPGEGRVRPGELDGGRVPAVPGPGGEHTGIIARYARGEDYHGVLRNGLEALHRRLQEHLGREVPGRAYTDSGPLLERDLARRAGLGWVGRNTMVLHPRAGSYELLGALMLDLDLPPDAPFDTEHCGRCTRCLDACPTGALLGRDAQGAPVMDARLCIAYLTIELRGPIPRRLRPLMGTRIFGCDICQEVCPWNGAKPASRWPEADPAYAAGNGLDAPELVDLCEQLLGMSGKAFMRRFAHSPLSRARRGGLLRNVVVALGNATPPGSIALLQRALEDGQSLVRGHAAWSLGRFPRGEAALILSARVPLEEDPWVLDEIQAALAGG